MKNCLDFVDCEQRKRREKRGRKEEKGKGKGEGKGEGLGKIHIITLNSRKSIKSGVGKVR